MSRTESQKESQKKYIKGKDQIVIRLPHGLKKSITMHATDTRESVNAFMIRAIEEAMSTPTEPFPKNKDQLAIRLPEGKREEINTFAMLHNETTTEFVVRAATEAIANDNKK